MTGSPHRARNVAVAGAIVVALLLLSIIPVGGATLGGRFFDSLRIARPKAATAPTAAANARTLANVVAGILAESTTVVQDGPDQPSTTLATAGTAAGFTPVALSGRKDTPLISLLGEHTVGSTISRPLLVTLMMEAGRPDLPIAPSLDRAPFAITNHRGIRLQYGNCPAPPAATIANQINGPPPPSSDNSSCVVLVEVPRAGIVIPSALDTAAVLAIALELSGMSPKQAAEFQALFGWNAALSLSPPRSVRSYESVGVAGTRGAMVVTGGRRGPTYVLMWAKGDLVFTLTGYGSPADAVPLANTAS